MSAAAVSAQTRVIPRHVLDSIADPPVERLESLEFDREEAELGEIRDDAAPVQTVFRITNRGDSPVTVRRTSTSCGCTAALHDTLGIAPGKTAEIRVFYNPKGQAGHQLRKVYVYTDKSQTHPSAVLSLKVDVVPGAVPRGYPQAMGPLACSRKEVRFRLEKGQERATERISCLNTGDSPLRLAAMEGFLPAWAEMRTEPETMAPGTAGDIVIVIDRGRLPEGRSGGSAKIILDGIDTRPSQRTIEIFYELENED